MKKSAQMNAAVDFTDELTKEIVGLNVYTLSDITGKSIDSIATLADLDRMVIIQYKNGKGVLDQERLEALAGVFDLSPDLLVSEYGVDKDRENFWRKKLVELGLMEDSSGSSDDSDGDQPFDETQSMDEAQSSGEVIDFSGKLDGGDDSDSEEASNHELLTAEPVWDESGLVLSLGDVEYNFGGKEERFTLMQHVRAALNRANKKINDLVKADIIPANGKIRGVETGKALMRREEIEGIANLLNSSVQELATGFGLEKYQVGSVARSPHVRPGEVGLSVLIQPVKDDEFQAFFERQVTSDKATFVDGFNPLSVLRRVKDGESVDWVAIWFEKTTTGRQFDEKIGQMVKQLKAVGPPLQLLILNEVQRRVIGQG